MFPWRVHFPNKSAYCYTEQLSCNFCDGHNTVTFLLLKMFAICWEAYNLEFSALFKRLFSEIFDTNVHKSYMLLPEVKSSCVDQSAWVNNYNVCILFKIKYIFYLHFDMNNSLGSWKHLIYSCESDWNLRLATISSLWASEGSLVNISAIPVCQRACCTLP